MKKRFYLLIAMVLLLGLLPATAAAAPPKPPYVSVRLWTFPPETLPGIAKLSAWDINWRVPKAATIELGYVQCVGGLCETVVEVTYTISRAVKYPQLLDLAGKLYHRLETGNCTSHQFVNIRDREGNILAATQSQECDVCIDP